MPESSYEAGQSEFVVEYPSQRPQTHEPQPRGEIQGAGAKRRAPGSGTLPLPASRFPIHEDRISRVVVNIPERILRVYRQPQREPGGTVRENGDTPREPGLRPVDDFTPIAAEYPVAVGMKRYPTPLMNASVTARRDRPVWFAPREPWAGKLAGATVPFDSAENPFRARNAKGSLEGYFIAVGTGGVGLHSTGEPRSVGRLASHGCIRMRLDDVRHLYRNIPDGTPVQIAYDLFRLERMPSGIRINAFNDVYARFSTADKIDVLCRKFTDYGIAISDISSEQMENLVNGRSIEITCPSQPKNSEFHAQLKEQQEFKTAPEALTRGQNLPALLAKSVADNLVIVNFP